MSQLFLGDLDENQADRLRDPASSKSKGMQTQGIADENSRSPKNKRKSLPAVPSPEEEKSMNLSVARQRSPANPTQVKAYGPYFLEYTLMAE